METILDIKNALKDVPDELLGGLRFGCGEGCEEQISMLASEGSGKYEFPQVFVLIDKKYPRLNELNKLIQNIAKAQGILDAQNEESEKLSEKLMESDGITQDFFDKKKKKK